MYERCYCGATDCPTCGPMQGWRIEDGAADEDAELAYQRMLEDEDDDTPAVKTDLF